MTVPLTVNIVANTTVDPPYLKLVPDIHTIAGQAVTVPSLPVYIPSGNPPASFAYSSDTPSDGSLTISNFSTTTGKFTVTPANGYAGESVVFRGRSSPTEGSSYDTQLVPVFADS